MLFLLGFSLLLQMFVLSCLNDYGNICTHLRKSLMSILLDGLFRVSKFILCPLRTINPKSGSAHVLFSWFCWLNPARRDARDEKESTRLWYSVLVDRLSVWTVVYYCHRDRWDVNSCSSSDWQGNFFGVARVKLTIMLFVVRESKSIVFSAAIKCKPAKNHQ